MRVAPEIHAACRQAEAALEAGNASAALRTVQAHLGPAVGDPWVVAARAMVAMGDVQARGPLLTKARAARTWLSTVRMDEALGDGAMKTSAWDLDPAVRSAKSPSGSPSVTVVVWGDAADDATALVKDLGSADAIIVVGAACKEDASREADLAGAFLEKYSFA